MADLILIENGNGAELILRGNDLAVCEGFENLPYLSSFCGNGWWGNELLIPEPAARFSCRTEEVLKSVSLGSAGRQAILNALSDDLKSISDNVPDTKITQNVTVSNDRADINISINGQEFAMNWEPDSEFLNYKV